jgi:hypothetical protein
MEPSRSDMVCSSQCPARPLIISGMYRSGTSLLWRILSADPSYIAYFYEPLHPELPKCVENFEFFLSYQMKAEILQKWSPGFHINRFHLSKEQRYRELEEYLRELVCTGSLIKFTRATLRLGWIMERFPSAFVINIVRDPRAVCFSYAKRGGIALARERSLRQFLGKAIGTLRSRKRPPSIHWHSEYLKGLKSSQRWGEYAEYLLGHTSCVRILGLWRINVEQSLDDLSGFSSNRSLTVLHENLCRIPDKTLKKLYQSLGRKIPGEVTEALREDSEHSEFFVPGHKFHLGLSDKWLEQWMQVDNEIWEDALRQADIIPLMERLGY